MVNRNILNIPLDYLAMGVGLLAAIMSMCYIGSYVYIIQNISGYAEDIHKDSEADLDVVKKNLILLLVMGLIINAIVFVASVVLILGAFRISSKLVLPWLIAMLCYLVFFLIIVCLLATTRKDVLEEFKTIGAVIGLSLTFFPAISPIVLYCNLFLLGFIIIAAALIAMAYRYLRYQNAL